MNESLFNVIGLSLTIFAAVWSLAWWLSGKFELMHQSIDRTEKSLCDKLEYHERHDDTRFSGLHNDIWELRVHNAARDGSFKKKDTAAVKNGND